MIHHIIKIIWNERKANAWIVLEFFLVFCVLWFCIDYLFFSGKLYFEAQGYDVEHVYLVNIQEDGDVESIDQEKKYDITTTMLERIRQYPGVESTCISKASIPYSWWNMNYSYRVNGDTIPIDASKRLISPEFFDVYKINFVKGEVFEYDPVNAGKKVIISANRDDMFGSYPEGKYPVNEVRTIHERDDEYIVTGVVEKIKTYLNQPFYSSIFFPITKADMAPNDGSEITFRVNPAADKDFAERFNRDMENLLSISPYIFHSITPVKEKVDNGLEWFAKENLRSVIAVTAFLVANIFLGIIGTFWSRIQSRRSEIGLRVALGSSKKKVKWMMFAEALLMLFIFSIPAAYVCINLGQTDFLKSFGIPAADRVMVGVGNEQDVINYLSTFLVLGAIVGLAVWYPARLSTNMAPAEALRDE